MKAAAVALVAAAAVVAAGCGGKAGGPGVASLNGAQTTTTTAAPPATGGNASGGNFSAKLSGGLRFSRCMRAHGVPSFPDPDSSGGISIASGHGIDPSSPQFQSAQQACQKDLPVGKGSPPSPAQLAQMQETFLKFSRCMRSHGVPNFPDPQISTHGNGVAVKIGGPGSGLDPNSPLFRQAQNTCRQYLPGGGKGIGGPGRAVTRSVAVGP